MAESISRISDEPEETSTVQPMLPTFPREFGSALVELAETVKALSESGILSAVTSLAQNYQDTITALMDGLSDDRMENFVLNLSSIFTLLSRLPPGMVKNFMENAAEEMTKGSGGEPQKPLGLLSMGSLFKDQDVSAGLRILVGTMKGFTKFQNGKNGEK